LLSDLKFWKIDSRFFNKRKVYYPNQQSRRHIIQSYFYTRILDITLILQTVFQKSLSATLFISHLRDKSNQGGKTVGGFGVAEKLHSVCGLVDLLCRKSATGLHKGVLVFSTHDSLLAPVQRERER